MWLLPLGLGLNFKKVPYVTLLLSVFIVGVYISNFGSRKRIEVGIEKASVESQYNQASKELFAEYCKSRSTAKKCSIYSEKMFNEEGNEKTQGSTEEHDEPPVESLREVMAEFERYGKDLEMMEAFLGELSTPSSITTLSSYAGFDSARNKRNSLLKDLYDKEKLLSKISINPESLLMAQFRHAGLLHLFGNLMLFFVFGAYVEIRMGAGLYALTFFLGGMAGLLGHILFFSPEETFIVGASANVSAVMGAFFVLFRKFRMKFTLMFLVFPVRSFFASVALMFPLMFVLGEVASAVESGMSSTGGVAHSAHLIGMGFGVLLGLVERRFMPVDWPFLNEEEVHETHQLDNLQDKTEECVRLAHRLLAENPENAFARYYALKSIYSNNPSSEDRLRYTQFVKQHLDDFLAVYFRKGRWSDIKTVLNLIPLSESLEELLVDSGQSTLLTMADNFVELESPKLALRLYDTYLIKYPRSRNRDQVLVTCAKVIELLDGTEATKKWCEEYLQKENVEIRSLINKRKMRFKQIS